MLFCIFFATSNGELSEETKQLVSEWTPLYWLHPEEIYFPSNMDYYLKHMELRDKEENVIMGDITAETLPGGPETKDWHLNTFEDLECVDCHRPHFFGQPLDQVISGTCFLLLICFLNFHFKGSRIRHCERME